MASADCFALSHPCSLSALTFPMTLRRNQPRIDLLEARIARELSEGRDLHPVGRCVGIPPSVSRWFARCGSWTDRVGAPLPGSGSAFRLLAVDHEPVQDPQAQREHAE